MLNLSKESNAYYENVDYYEIFSQAEDANNQVLQYLVEKTKDKIVLDAGCGSGKYLPFVSLNCKQYYGVDLSTNQLALASKKINTENVKLYCCNLKQIPLPNHSIDIIYASWVLGTILDLDERLKVLQEFHRVLKPNGAIILIENAENSEFEKIRNRDKDNRTIEYNNWILNQGFCIISNIKDYFHFKDINEAKKTFETIYGNEVASKIKRNKIEHNIIIFQKNIGMC